jgi:hypothetical protein
MFWQHSGKCDMCHNAVLSCRTQYTVTEIRALCVTFTVVHEVTLSVADWQIYIFGGVTREKERETTWKIQA